jgi:transposase, IS6 family
MVTASSPLTDTTGTRPVRLPIAPPHPTRTDLRRYGYGWGEGGLLRSPVRRSKAGLTGEACCSIAPLVSTSLGVRRVPVPVRGDRGGDSLVPRYGLSYRDVEELLAERGIEVDHVTVYRWVQRFTPLLADAARFARHSPADRWFVDKTYVKVNGVWRYVYRAIDQNGQVIDVLVSARRDATAARRFFTRALRTLKVIPSEVVTDAAPVYPGVLEELLPSARHHVEQYANNPIEADHGQLKHRLRPMRGLRTDRTAQVVIAGHAFLQNLRRGHYELGVDARPALRIAAAFTELAEAI